MVVQREELMTSAEVAAMFGVNRSTPVQWAKTGRISAVRTPGGHRRYRRHEIIELLAGGSQAATARPTEESAPATPDNA